MDLERDGVVAAALLVGGVAVSAVDVGLIHEAPGIGIRELLHALNGQVVLVDKVRRDAVGRRPDLRHYVLGEFVVDYVFINEAAIHAD